MDADLFRERVRAVVAGDEWVLAGNYGAQQRDISWPRATAIVWLDLPLRITLPRLLRRSFARWRSGEPSWGGRERFWSQFKLWDQNASLIAWTLRHHGPRRRSYEAAMVHPEFQDKRFVRLESSQAIRVWLAPRARRLAL